MSDSEVLAGMIREFFAAFVSKDVGPVRLDSIKPLFIPQALVIKTCGGAPVVDSLDSFIDPRQKLLTDGRLLRFTEKALSIKTEIFGDIAHSFVVYGKAGVLDGAAFDQKGMKTFQFVRTLDGWKICSLAWDDERPGLAVAKNL